MANQECFVIMPITDPDGYSRGHFASIYQDLFVPACEKAGFAPLRADQVRETSLIHHDILQRILSAPMAICDLSSRNPNVLFELGIRQAFDKPVLLVQERDTPQIFDIAPLRYTEYRPALIYREVLEDQDKIAEGLRSTKSSYDSGSSVHSVVRVLSLTKPASIPETEKARQDPLLQIIMAELSGLRSDLRRSLVHREIRADDELFAADLEQIQEMLAGIAENVALAALAGEPQKEISERIERVAKRLSFLQSLPISPSASRLRVARFYNRIEELSHVLREMEDRNSELIGGDSKPSA